ncbi:A/G-specific adenine glycosylase [Globicatella sulfidifaciens]|uniref:Adenine DNA glycosylase n=1 Tax=Globicatella sulfidifaciens DSM 15739 TaxID=1121925 RepID=A0A1T4JJ66_9LACT|nr:A/G-specific adenine glycosylase [Globicatella sulfidifaciens]SJZ30199.1 A/G-specific DNA-adenine glycosylase [Globicatella sulfidifaciens DSM 15739]
MTQVLAKYGWNDQKVKGFRAALLDWYDQNKRDLPWRRTRNPYYIWISEIMLQQTQVATVIPYFERFIKALPTIEALANVDEQELLLLWQGLGYYSRARNLKVAAQQIMEHHQGQMPQTMPELLKLKGIGPYTAAAIGSMAFDLVEPAIDGNLLRVTARIFELDADISKPSSRKIFAEILYELIDPERPGDFNQAMMDLGATVMTPTNYYPEDSPIKAYDQSFINETAALYPVKKKKIKNTKHQMLAYRIQDLKGSVLYRQHTADELLTGLWHYPIFEYDIVLDSATEDELLTPLEDYFEQLGLGALKLKLMMNPSQMIVALPKVKHVFSHRTWNLQVVPVQLEDDLQALIAGSQGLTTTASDQEHPISTLQQKLQARWEGVNR